MLQLCLQHVLLISLTDSIPVLRYFLNLIEQLIIPLQNAQRLLNVGQVKIHLLQIFDYLTPNRIRLLVQRVSFALSYL